MKKIILKIFTTATTLIALFFIVFLILTTFGRVPVEEFNNTIVRTICIILGGLFLLLSITSHVILYINDDVVKEIVLRSGKEGTARTSLAVVKKITKNTIKGLEGVKCRKCAVVSNDYGIRLKVWIVVKDRDMKETEELVRAYLEDAFLGALDFRFFAIDVHLKQIDAKHKVDKEEIMQKIAAAEPKTEEIEEPKEELPEEKIEETPTEEIKEKIEEVVKEDEKEPTETSVEQEEKVEE